ncbi:MAG: hypothetical protein NTW87_18920 [Planctomycetota bacterium]|nr:hypothetical protein [Planctomycetota bacterium]
MNHTAWRAIEGALPHLSQTEKLTLLKRVARSMSARKQAPSAARQREALRELRRELAALPVHNPEDGFSNRDHDKVLYGGTT